MTRLLRRGLAYFRDLTLPRLVLWCYLIWYLYTLARYFDSSPRLWLSSLGISGIIGLALYLSTALSGKVRLSLDRWQVFRLFLMPFCVSSFAALIKGRGFVLIFHPGLADNAVGLGACAVFVTSVKLLKLTTTAAADAPKQAVSPPWRSPT